MQATATRRAPRWLSLTWRVVALSSLLLLALVALFVWLGQHYLTQQLESTRLQHHERQQREIRLAMQRSSDGLRQLAGLTAAAPELGNALLDDDSAELDDLLSAQWPALQLEGGVDNIYIYNRAGEQVIHFGISGGTPLFPARRWIDDVLNTEAPITTLRCALACQQFAAVPVLLDGESRGVVIFTRDLADVMREVKAVSGSEIALMVTGNLENEAQPQGPRIPEWNGQIIALTRVEQTLPILQTAAAETSIYQLVNAPYSAHHDNRYLEVSAVYMQDDSDWRSTGYFLLVADTSLAMISIQAATQGLLLVGVIGWLLAELLLLMILLRPMARLRGVADLLPTLARGEFEQVRERLLPSRSHWKNEIDVLEEATRTLSVQLQTLQGHVNERNSELSTRIDELARERDFVNGLLNTAQVFIIAQDKQGCIRLANSYTYQALGLEESDLVGRHFDDVFNRPQPVSSAPWSTGIPQRPLPEESTFRVCTRQLATAVWYHASLGQTGTATLARISVGLDITERKAAEARLTWLAERDTTTELYNRRYFQDALMATLAQHAEVAVLLLDLDRFKEINELSGHHVGDRLLKDVAFTLSANLGQRSTIARLGGDEFALLMTDINSEQAIKVAEYVIQLINAIEFSAAGRKHHIGASVGIALFPMHGQTPEDLLASADIAMYKAKERGSPHWHLLSMVENAKDELQERVYWIERIRQALEHDEFEIWVQPIVRLDDRSVKHFEVLLRMRNADTSLVTPAHFIPVAEQSGLITQVDRWVIRHSLQALHALQGRGISLSVNLSGQSLHDHGLPQYLMDEFQESQADPHHLILEVTETAAITDFSVAHNVLQKFRQLGCRTALDDFGVGFSSFHYLGQLPVDYIKIDGSFIRNLLVNPDSHTIVKAISDIAKGFGKQTIAEFVDQEELLPLLQEHGIHYAQGYHLGRPMPLTLLLDGRVHE
ncbi:MULTISPECIES: EAL domain-containing protein [unclassified Halomonas]|uniref:bifunctional diguanylate cyclase/phosphodiesterase n=1 Tax=unclassified Halomonas TaxID=2609666 RepID=UPI00209F5DB4|nr:MULTISPECIES: EAL domain-containing protein [unclassified Halomonas]MCP1315565.1 EAL domain-containing protein [Halomonas sp. 707D7]MCP1327162.1 EAL domain-containing protein [Halomonas sp. 707D4]